MEDYKNIYPDIKEIKKEFRLNLLINNKDYYLYPLYTKGYCSICNLETPYKLYCNHPICKDCLLRWFIINDNCNKCNKPIIPDRPYYKF